MSRSLVPMRQLARQMHTSRALFKPAGAASQYIKGTVNDPTTFPEPNRTHGSLHWSFERAMSAALVPLVASAAVTSSNPVLDGILCTTLIVHSHIGFDCILADYLHPRKWGAFGHFMTWFLRFATGGALVGLYQFETNDIGLTELLKKMWKA